MRGALPHLKRQANRAAVCLTAPVGVRVLAGGGEGSPGGRRLVPSSLFPPIAIGCLRSCCPRVVSVVPPSLSDMLLLGPYMTRPLPLRPLCLVGRVDSGQRRRVPSLQSACCSHSSRALRPLSTGSSAWQWDLEAGGAAEKVPRGRQGQGFLPTQADQAHGLGRTSRPCACGV